MTFADNYFMLAEPNIVDNDELREPQVLAYIDTYRHFQMDKSVADAVVILPTGAGKTGVIGLVPYGISQGRVLVITPQLVIKDHVVESLDPSEPENFWLKRKVFGSYEHLPIVTEYDNETLDDELINSNMIILNIHKLSAKFRNSLLNKVPPDFFDMIIIDEAHHSPAETWQSAIDYFQGAKVVKVTGTPFRTDRKPITGKVITDYRLGRAMQLKIVKSLENFKLIPDKILLTIDEDLNKTYTLEELLALGIKDENYVHRSVALSTECNVQIIHESIKVWNQKKLGTNVPHKIIAVACSIPHAKKLQELYSERGLTSLLIHSAMSKQERRATLLDVENHRCDVIIHVAMLGEGYDHPYLSVAAIFRPFRSLAPYSQFIGRVLRYIPDHETSKPSDNIATVIAHRDLGLDILWQEYQKELEIKTILEKVKQSEKAEKNLNNKLFGEKGTYDKEIGAVQVSDELTIESEFYLYSDLIAENEKYEKEIKEKFESIKKTLPMASDEEIRRLIMSKQASNNVTPLMKNPKKFRMLIREQFHNKVYLEIPATFISKFQVKKEDRDFAAAIPKQYSWISNDLSLDNAAIISVYFNTKLKEQFGERSRWTIEDYSRANEYLDSLVIHTLDIIKYVLKGRRG